MTVTDSDLLMKVHGTENAIQAQQKQLKKKATSISIYHNDQPKFKIKDVVEDPAIGQMTKAIFPFDEPEWTGID